MAREASVQELMQMVSDIGTLEEAARLNTKAPSIGTAGLSALECASLLLLVVVYDRMLPLMKRNEEGRAALRDLCVIVKEKMIEEMKKPHTGVIKAAWEDIEVLVNFFLAVDNPEGGFQDASGALDMLQSAKHGALSLCKTALAQCPFWRDAEAKYRKLLLHQAQPCQS